MIQLFLISLLLILVGGLILYRFTGKKRLLKFDLVQFVYAFIIAPLVFVWLKTFVFYLMQGETRVLSQAVVFAIDTAVSLLGLYIYSFVIIHFLTKNFEIKRYRDPVYDIFQLSEVIHLWISHLGIYFGALLAVTLLAVFNLYFPIEASLSRIWLVGLMMVGTMLGAILYVAVWLSNFTKGKFMKINKIMFAAHFFVLLVSYFLFEVRFSAEYLIYWVFFCAYFSTNFFSIFLGRSKKLMTMTEKWHHKYQDGWSGLQQRFNNPS